MTPRSLFNVILKIFGLFFLKEIINTVPQLISYILFLMQAEEVKGGIVSLIFTALIVAFYCYIFYLLIFKTNNIIDKLKIDQGFNQQEFSFNLSTSKVLTIALFVIAGVIFANEIPNLCRQFYTDFQEKRMTNGITKQDFSYSIISAVKIVIGFLLIGERKRIIGFIEKRGMKNYSDEK